MGLCLLYDELETYLIKDIILLILLYGDNDILSLKVFMILRGKILDKIIDIIFYKDVNLEDKIDMLENIPEAKEIVIRLKGTPDFQYT
jgi:hypothetical protein